MTITAGLISEGTDVILRKYDYSGSSGLIVYQFSELLKEADLVAKSLSETSDVVADKLLSELEPASRNHEIQRTNGAVSLINSLSLGMKYAGYRY